MYIELHRTFRELRSNEQADDATALMEDDETLTLSELLQERRAVVLSEGGSGKTWELLEAVKRLRSEGKAAFFLRLEHVMMGFDRAFDEGDMGEFLAWLESTEPGWFLLDSIDESRLRSPQDFATAMREVSSQLSKAKDRAHLIISGRPSAWRPRSDLALCIRLFPLAKRRSEQDSFETHNFEVSTASADRVFKVLALQSLSPTQVDAFAVARGIKNTKPFLDAIEKGDAWSFTQRPQDLEDLVGYWIDNGKLGSRSDWMTASINRRLQDSQDRAEARPLTPARARKGVEKLAAALILTRRQNIKVPDGHCPGSGLSASEVLGWDDSEITTLLQRPLFNQDVYGTVRFHHRSVLEYLAAQWFLGLLQSEVSRRRIEDLFFREQYGLQVVVPSLRPLLPWLAMEDERVLARLSQVGPEIIFEGGDPQRFPAKLRSSILEKVCKQLATGTSTRSMAHHSAIQRFAAPDVSETVRHLLNSYKEQETVASFLLRMVWLGDIKQALPEALEIARSSSSTIGARTAAFRAVDAVGTQEDLAEIRALFANEGDKLNRECMADLLSLVQQPDAITLQWIMDCIPRLEEFDENESSGLSRVIARFFERADIGLSALAIEQLQAFMTEPPVIEHPICTLSDKYKWLCLPTGAALSRLLQTRHETALKPVAIAALHVLAQDDAYDLDYDVKKLGLPNLVQGWPGIKWAWLWHNIEQLRNRGSEGEQQVNTPWTAWGHMHTVSWNVEDFHLALAALQERSLDDDKLIALQIAFRLYLQLGRMPEHLREMEFAVRSNSTLQAHLQQLLTPQNPSESLTKWEQHQAEWELRAQKRTEEAQRQRRDAVEQLAQQLDQLRDPRFEDPDAISQSQAYLFKQMRSLEEDRGSHWTRGQWRTLEAEFGAPTALAFRDGMVTYWRKHSPRLISEGAQLNSVPLSDLFGLTGLTIEAKETPQLISTISAAEARIAFRYAMRELNGFPHWFGDLCASHPDVVAEMALDEVKFELEMETPDTSSYYLIGDICHSGEWLGNRIAPHLVQLLSTQTCFRPLLLENLLDILLASNIDSASIVTLASSQVAAAEASHLPLWVAAWTSVDPGPAIDAVEQILFGLSSAEQRTEFIMAFAFHLLGSRTRVSRMRTTYQTPAVLKRLYLLIHQHVRAEEDIDRTVGGVYSPGIRDDAQDARESLVRMLGAIQGREAFQAIHAISKEHPQTNWRPWFVQQAIAKAQTDSERPAWNEKQVHDFSVSYEQAPANHRELFDLAVLRLLDLKHATEDGDLSTASVVVHTERETHLRNWIAEWCSRHTNGRFVMPQEDELPDAKRPDLRWMCSTFKGAVPTELKIADNWTGAELFERLEGQLAGDYLRDCASSRGIYLLVWRGVKKQNWHLDTGKVANFEELLNALQAHWESVAETHPSVEEIKVIGIDLTKRSSRT